MNSTREDFCRGLLDDDAIPHRSLDPESLAGRFVHYFALPARPSMEQIKLLLRHAGFGEVSGRHLDVKGIHYSVPGGGYDILYREDLWAGAQDYSVLHETYEIIHETLCDMHSGSMPDRAVCREAERFAAAVLMQPRAFKPLALEWGLDVLKLQSAFRCSYAAVTLRLAEVLSEQPLMTVLYESGDSSDPTGWTGQPDLRATVVRRTRGFGTPVFPVCGHRGGIPRRGRSIPDGSLAERAARTGTAQYAHDGVLAVISRPVIWKGKLAKVLVVAVPAGDSYVLDPQVIAVDVPGGRRNLVPAAVAAGPW